MTEKLYTGRVQIYSCARSFGFIIYSEPGTEQSHQSPETEESIFVHRSDINLPIGYQKLRQGDEVSFSISDFSGRPTAKNVTILRAASVAPVAVRS